MVSGARFRGKRTLGADVRLWHWYAMGGRGTVRTDKQEHESGWDIRGLRLWLTQGWYEGSVSRTVA